MTDKVQSKPAQERLFSLDFYRGLTMFLLIGEGTHLYNLLVDPAFEGSVISFIGTQFHHHPWNGLRFWDLVQPFFMFIVGVAMPFSFANRSARRDNYPQIRKHAIQRSFILLFLGWALYCIGPGRITFELWNVLAQLSITYIIAFFMMRKPIKTQIIFSFALIAFSELIYRVWPVEGFNQPFVADKNFGAWFDLLIMGKLSGGHWVAFNAIPTTAHTMWGVLAGLILRSERRDMQKFKILLISGIIGLIIGYALDPVTPIIKRICTSSFVIASGGWCLVALAVSYFLVDMKGIKSPAKFFAIVGMNPLFIYLFNHTGGTDWIYKIIKPFSMGIFSLLGEDYAQVITAAILWMMLWYICYWLYKRKIFIKI